MSTMGLSGTIGAPSGIPGRTGNQLPRPSNQRRAGREAISAQAWLPRIALGELAVPIAVLGILLALVTPIPPFLLDILLSANITLSTVILLACMYIRRPAEFSIFPTTLLLMTLFRLALNVSSSRLILLHGSKGTAAAGEVIESFGNFVVGGNFAIGVVIFLVLIAIQYVVINHGAVRISEVTARFTLDALPGKQMSIDADLNSGLISEAEAKSRRKFLSAEAEFYGAMDGATRFTQRDAVASILITAINIIAGFLIGVLQYDMTFGDALKTFTVLTVGDGLVTVIPALMISISGGLIVTRASSEEGMGSDFRVQVFGKAEPMMLASGVLISMALFPGLPKLPFLILGMSVGYAALSLKKKQFAESAAPAKSPEPASENLEDLLRVEPLSVEIGLGLVRLVEEGKDSMLVRRIGAIRRQLAIDYGYILPAVRITDNLALGAREYSVSIKGIEVARFELPQGQDLAIPSAAGKAPEGGVPATEPAFGINAFWVPSHSSDKLRADGFTVVDSLSVLGTHLSEVIRRHMHEILSRQDAKGILDRVAQESAKLVEDLVPKLLPLATVHRVFQNLLRERVSIRDAVTVLEALGEAAAVTRNPILLTEYVRQSIRRILVRKYLTANGEIHAFFLDTGLERAIEQGVDHSDHASHMNLPPSRVREIVDSVASGVGSRAAQAVLLTTTGARYFLRQILDSHLPNLCVLSHAEIPAGVRVLSLGVLRGGK